MSYFNEKEMVLWDISDATDTRKLSEIGYNDIALQFQYIHSGWVTEDKRSVLLHDEFDENRGGLNTTVRIFDINNLPSFNLTGESHLSAFSSVATITLFAFLGIECATIPAGNIDKPEKTIPRATMLGTIIVTILYILGTVILFGILPLDVLQKSPAPFAEAAKIIGGEYGGYIVAVGVIISGLGVLNGWILITGQISMSTAKDNLFPSFFERENKKGAPVLGFIIGGVLSSLVMLMSFSDGLVEQFEFIVQLTVFVALVPYLFSSAAYALILIEKKLHSNSWVKTFVLATFGFGYSLWAIYGSGNDTVYYGFLLLLLGVPVYIYMKWIRSK